MSTRIKCPDHRTYNCPNCPGRGYLRASDHMCMRCGGKAESWQHRVAKGRGGPDDLLNCIPLCGSGTTSCHGWAEANPEEARAQFYDVPGYFVRGVYHGPDPMFQEAYNGEVDG